MSVEIKAIGGWGEVGKNMTAVRVDNDVVIFDIGLHLPNYIKVTEDEPDEFNRVTETSLKQADAVPQDGIIKDWKSNVRAIVVTHAHLDHVGAVPYLANRYNCPIICTPMTGEVLKAILTDEKIDMKNPIKIVQPNSTFKISDNLTVELVHVTHSIPHTSMIALHTKYGIVLYATDFKFDNTPTLGKKPNYELLEKLGKKGILVAICDSLNSHKQQKTPSENIAKEMLRDCLLGVNSKGKALIVTTFSSHIARLKSIIDCGKQLNRKIVFMGRSLTKYVYAAKDAEIIDLTKEAKVLKYKNDISRMLKKIEEARDKYLIVCTGHQGEPNSALSKIANNILHFKFKTEDLVVFSCNIIPTEINREQRKILEELLLKRGVRIFKDIHVSGHASREDVREFIKLTKPKHLIPIHGDAMMMDAFSSLAEELGYKHGDSVHQITNGRHLSVE